MQDTPNENDIAVTRSASVSSPTRREMTDWIVAYIREKNVPEKGSVPWEDLEELIGNKRDDAPFVFAVSDAIRQLTRSTPSVLFRRDASLGLVRLAVEERGDYAAARRSEATNKVSWALEIVNTTEADRLTPEQRSELDRERMRLIHAKRELERVKSRRWIEQSARDPKMLE